MTNDSDSKQTPPEPNGDASVSDHRAMVKEQAATWLIRINDDALTPDNVESLREWIGRSDFHREYFIYLSRNWDEMAALQELAKLFAVPPADTVSGSRNSQSHFPSRLAFSGIAATASFIVCMVLLLFGLSVLDSTITLQTAVGEQRVDRLDDGSILTLNTNSKLSVDYSDDNRIIRLYRGEVNFNVAKDPYRPFVVYAGEGLVWAVGTTFNIRIVGGSVDLTVTEGRVKVYSGIAPTEPLPLLAAGTVKTGLPPTSDQINEALVKAGEVLQYTKVIAQRDEVQDEQIKRKLAWQRGALIFKGETLEQAVTEIRRYTDRELRIIDPDIEDKKVGGYYKTDDIDSLLRSLSKSFGIRVVYLDNGIVHLSSEEKTF